MSKSYAVCDFALHHLTESLRRKATNTVITWYITVLKLPT